MRRFPSTLAALVILLAGIGAYHNSFSVPFLFDDLPNIVENSRLHHGVPLGKVVSGSSRPVTDLSFWLNGALGGLNVWGYHAVNLAIHLLAGLVLFGIVRRTLAGERLKARYGNASQGLALAVALLWVVHPLQTESVTYIIQRSESLMGLFALATLYGTIRSADAIPRRKRWVLVAILSCILGMASKPTMAAMPLVVLLYDRIFLSASWGEIWRQRRNLYAGLAASWGILGIILIGSVAEYRTSAGFLYKGMTPIQYALTQPGVILHYLRLAFWPSPLVLDYGWPVARGLNILLPSVLLLGVLSIVLWMLRAAPGAGFLGASFFLLLAPSSSFIPLADPAFEHRMYLPLAPLLTAAVMGVVRWHQILSPSSPGFRRGIAWGLLLGSTVLLGDLTLRRNQTYQRAVSIWSDVVAQRPQNPRGHANLGTALADEGKLEEAIAQLTEALGLKFDSPDAHSNLGEILFEQGRLEEAVSHDLEAMRIKPNHRAAHTNLGLALAAQERYEEAIGHYVEALRLDPADAPAHNNFGALLDRLGANEEAALFHYREALRANPAYVEAHVNLGNLLFRLGETEEPLAQLREALRLNPHHAQAYNNLGNILFALGRRQEALDQYAHALWLKPLYAEAHNNAGAVLSEEGRLEEAILHYREALRLKPNFTQARLNLKFDLAQLEKRKKK